MRKRALHHRLGARLAVALEKVPLERAGVDTDPHRAAVILCGLYDLAHPLGGADVAGIDAQARGSRLGGLDRALIVEMNVGDDRHLRAAHDLFEGGGRAFVRTGHADDVGARARELVDLPNRRLGIRGEGIGHGLDGYRRIAADQDFPHPDLSALASLNLAIGSHRHGELLLAGGSHGTG